MARIRIGISGWRYTPWRGVFYPRGLPQRAELAYAARIFSAIEVNGSFYSLQYPQSFAQWYADAPPDFVFALKGPRYITHMLKLRDIERPLANFFASGLFCLKEKLGPILWQFPPRFAYRADRFENFCALLPKDTDAAAALARRRDARMHGRSRLAPGPARALRHAIEVRDPSFLVPEFIELLRRHGIALVTAETAGRWPLRGDITADFAYLRLHGNRRMYQSGYGERSLERWAARIRAWHEGGRPADVGCVLPGDAVSPPRPRDVYCFFDNTDVKLRAPADAQALMRRLGLARPGPDPLAAAARRRPLRPPRRASPRPRPDTTRHSGSRNSPHAARRSS